MRAGEPVRWRASRRARLACLLAALLAASAGARAEAEDAVAWAGFTTGFENGAPRDRVRVVSTRVPTLYYVSELRGLAGRTVIHRWSRDGRVEKERRFEVEGARWRAVSRHAPGKAGVGTWSVEVVEAESGRVLRTDRLRYLPEEARADERTGGSAS